ncbi:hypothetical protein [Devosia sp. RR2S18]|uniref:hypothetical protein n=1 Tax=Devosia rhizosphaerae TaxID=3049774 RepID=UPI002541DF46|nr:hypothetical protein [Devosia sp. RR2S18]WIJ23977.1 hypothetical protein QOV41_13135 [Devosia sp. RR2S18]
MQRVVIAVGPSGNNGHEDKADEIGIVVAGEGVDDRSYILGDHSCSMSPDGRGRSAVLPPVSGLNSGC